MKKLILPIVIVVLALQVSVHAQETDIDLDRGVADILTRMTDFISAAPAYSIVAVMGHEVLQSNGQMLEFGSNIKVSLRRPSQAIVRFDNRDGENATIILDGDTISVFSTIGKDHAYDVTRQPGDIDASFVFLAEQLGAADQLHHFFSIDLTESMKSMAKSGYYVGEATIAGILCDNLALRNEDEDVQLWVAKGDKPVPRRIVVTYKNLDGQPQFWAQFEDWNFLPNLSETSFSYSPPAHGKRIDFFRDTPVDNAK